MNRYDETQHPREHDGKFATKATAEADGGLEALAEQSDRPTDPEAGPVPLSHALGDVGELSIDRSEHGDTVFEQVEITRQDDGTFRAESSVVLGFREGMRGWVPGLPAPDGNPMSDEHAERVDAWLQERSDVIDAWLADEYDVERTDGDEWDWQQAVVSATLPADASTEDVMEALASKTSGARLYNESDPGTNGSRNMWRVLGKHLTEHDEQLDDATGAYLEASLWTEEDQLPERDDGAWLSDDVADEDRVAVVASLRRFMVTNRHAIAQAQAEQATYDAAQVGHDLWLTRNGHGAGFWDRGLGEVGDHLTEAAKAEGTQDAYVGDDGRLHLS